jgi:hypothetical protein
MTKIILGFADGAPAINFGEKTAIVVSTASNMGDLLCMAVASSIQGGVT